MFLTQDIYILMQLLLFLKRILPTQNHKPSGYLLRLWLCSWANKEIYFVNKKYKKQLSYF